MQWPWVSRALYRNVLRQLAVSRRQAEHASERLEAERQRCDRMVRHLTSQFLRKQNAYGLPDEKAAAEQAATPMQITHGPRYDAGELAALVEEAERLGHSRESAIALFKKEKNLDDIELLM